MKKLSTFLFCFVAVAVLAAAPVLPPPVYRNPFLPSCGIFEAYAQRENLGSAGRAELQRLSAALDAQGLSDNFLDGGFFKAGLSSQFGSPVSVKGQAPTAQTAGWCWSPGGILTSNTAAGDLTWTVQDAATEATLVVWFTSFYNFNTATPGYAFLLKAAAGPASGQLQFFNSGGNANWVVQHYNGSGGAVTTYPTGRLLTDANAEFLALAWSSGGTVEITRTVLGVAVGEVTGATVGHAVMPRFQIGGLDTRLTVGAWLYFNRKLTGAELVAIDAAYRRNVLVVEGDSLSTTWPVYAAANTNLNGFVWVKNVSAAGETTAQMVTETNDWNATSVSSGRAYFAVMGGANDLANLSDSVDVILARLRVLWRTATVAGLYPVAFTVTRGAGITAAGRESLRVSLNEKIRADSTNYFALCDLDAAFETTLGSSYNLNTTYFNADAIHFVTPGLQFVADTFANTVRPATLLK